MVLCSLRHDAVDLADMDLDGDLDVIANMYYDYNDYRMEYLRNDGAGTTWVLTKIDSVLPVGLPVGTPHLVDVENDGDADLFVLTNDGDLYFVENLTYTNIVSESPALSRNFHLHQNYPNPFNPSTTIEFDMPKTSEVTLKIFNILGEEVATLLSASLLSGSHSVEWDASSLASGVYLYRLKAEDYVETRKMILMR